MNIEEQDDTYFQLASLKDPYPYRLYCTVPYNTETEATRFSKVFEEGQYDAKIEK